LGDRGCEEDATIGAGEIGSGMSAAGATGAGVTGAGKRRTKKGAGIMDTIGDVIHTVAPLAPLLLAAGKPKANSRAKRITGGDLSLLHYDELKGQPPLTAPANKKETVSTADPRTPRFTKRTTKADMPAAYVAGAKPKAPRKPNPRNEKKGDKGAIFIAPHG